jgi:hypothetical protein
MLRSVGYVVKTRENIYTKCKKVKGKVVRVIKSRRMMWARHVARMGEGRGAYRVLVGRPEGERPLGRPRRRWEVNIKITLGK